MGFFAFGYFGKTCSLSKKKSLGTSYGENLLNKRAKELEEFIPSEYKDELQGLSAGSGIAYDVPLEKAVIR